MKPNTINVKAYLTLTFFRKELTDDESKAITKTYGNSKSICPNAIKKPPFANFLVPIVMAEAVRGPGDSAPETDIIIVEMIKEVKSIKSLLKNFLLNLFARIIKKIDEVEKNKLLTIAFPYIS